MAKSLHLSSKTHDIDPSFWLKRYSDIADVLGLDPDADRKATGRLHRSMLPRSEEVRAAFARTEALLYSRPVLIFGCDPSLDQTIGAMKPILSKSNVARIAADGATSALLDADIVPDIVVTDLDGVVPDIVEASQRGAVIVLHAHGDNIDRVEKCLPRLRNVLPVTQTEPTEIVRNFGGFTDGDKALFLASAFGAGSVILVAMDFGLRIGPRSYGKSNKTDKKRKLIKLLVGMRLCGELLWETGLPAFSLSTVPPPGAKRIQLKDLPNLMQYLPPSRTYSGDFDHRSLPEDALLEMIMTTRNARGDTHAAPVGVSRKGDLLFISLAEGTRSLQNLKTDKTALLNLVTDPVVFARTAFDPGADVPLVEPGSEGPSPLRDAAAIVKVRLRESQSFTRSDELGDSKFQRLCFDVLSVRFHHPPQPYSRGFGLVLEAIVAVTKARIAAERGLAEVLARIQGEAVEYIRRARHIALDRSTKEALDLCESEIRRINRKYRREYG